MRFPAVTGTNLQRQRFDLPEQFQGAWNLLFVAFQQWQQSQVDSWLPFAKEVEKSHHGLFYYELPTIQRLNPLARTFINEGMRAGIPDPVARERTITLYVDKDAFRMALAIDDEEDIQVLLLDEEGQVMWKAQGSYTAEKGDALKSALHAADPSEGAEQASE